MTVPSHEYLRPRKLPPKREADLLVFLRRNWVLLFYVALMAFFAMSAYYSEPAPDAVDDWMTAPYRASR